MAAIRLRRPLISARLSSLLLLVLLIAVPTVAKDKKKKSSLPEYILQARTAVVVIDPDAGEPVDQPDANAIARENVEKALVEWGRFDLILPEQHPDLIFVVRAGNGKTMRPSVRGGPIDQRPVYGETTDSTVRVGAQQGHEPPLNDPSLSPPNTGPHMTNEVGPAEDMLAVYRGGEMDEYPLDSTPIWRDIAKECLQSPNVTGVQKLRKEIADAEKPQTQTKKP
jgi:hypothetical protein